MEEGICHMYNEQKKNSQNKQNSYKPGYKMEITQQKHGPKDPKQTCYRKKSHTVTQENMLNLTDVQGNTN